MIVMIGMEFRASRAVGARVVEDYWDFGVQWRDRRSAMRADIDLPVLWA